MRDKPILLVGGSGVVGAWTAHLIRRFKPHTHLLIAGRDLERAWRVAGEVGNAEGIAIDLNERDLGIGDRPIGAMAVFFKDDRLDTLTFAQDRGVAHVSISTGCFEMGPEASAFIHRPCDAPVVLASEWLAGAATLPALTIAYRFQKVRGIRVDAVLDEMDIGGPAAEIDLARFTQTAPAALTRKSGRFFWRVNESAAVQVRAIDGELMDGFGYSPFDIPALAAATRAPDIALNVAVGVSSTRRRGLPFSTEILIEVEGEAVDGSARTERLAIIHPQGQAPLTALGVAMMLERLTEDDPVPPGLYLPEQLVEPNAYLKRLSEIGSKVTHSVVPHE